MPLIPLLLAALLAANPPAGSASPQQDDLNLPVSLDRIKSALEETPAMPRLRGLNEVPTFKVEIHESSRPFTLEEELIQRLAPGFKAGPVPAGGLYAYELNRVTNDPVSNPLTQPYAAFSQPELLTVLIENLAIKYLGGKALGAISSAERAHAEAQAREEVHRAVADYCAAQPDGGRGIEICRF